MDSRSFDSLTRSLASGRTRRGVLGGLVALAAGARAAGRASATVVCPIPGQVLNRKGDCSCPPGQGDICPEVGCTSRRSDPSNCGSCGNVCDSGEICRKGECRCPDGAVCGEPPVLGNGALEEGDPVASGECIFGAPRRYDAITFDHPGGAASLVVWGEPSGRGTLPDPALFLFSGSTVPGDLCEYLAFEDDFCNLEPYLVFTDLTAGTYTAVIVDFGDSTGTYTFERNTFTPPLCV